MEYSEEVERHLCPTPRLYAAVRQWREELLKSRLERIISSRFFKVAFVYAQAGKDVEFIARKLTLDQGWTRDEAVKVIGQSLTGAIYG